MKDAVFTAPEVDVHWVGCCDPPFSLFTLYSPVQDVLLTQWQLTGAKGICGDFSTSPCTKKEDTDLQGATDTS